MPVDFNITCYHCSHFLTVSDEFVGQEVQCPVCEEEMLVPPAGRALKLEHVSAGEPRPIRPDEEEALQAQYPDLLVYMDGATTKNCWEFGIVAWILNERADQMRVAAESIPARPRIHERRHFQLVPYGDMVRFIHRMIDEFLGLQAELGELLDDGLATALYQDDILAMLKFDAGLGHAVERIAEYGRALASEELAEKSPYPELYAMLRQWPAHCCDVLDETVSLLQDVYEDSGANLWHSDVQMSLTPPDLYAFFLLKNQLPRKKAF